MRNKDGTDLTLAHVDCLRKQCHIALVINLTDQSINTRRKILLVRVTCMGVCTFYMWLCIGARLCASVNVCVYNTQCMT